MKEKYYVYIAILVVIVLLLMIVFASKRIIFKVYKKYSNIKNSTGTFGKNFAIASKNQLELNINLALIDGELSDCYSTKSKTLMMSEKNCNTNSLASIVIISHEIGHAVQDKNKNPLLILSNLLRSLCKLTNLFILPLLIAGIITFILSMPIYSTLFTISMILTLVHTLNNIMFIPLEIGASKFAIKYLKENKYLNFKEVYQAKKLLRVASLTYVASFLDGILIFKFRKLFRRK